MMSWRIYLDFAGMFKQDKFEGFLFGRRGCVVCLKYHESEDCMCTDGWCMTRMDADED